MRPSLNWHNILFWSTWQPLHLISNFMILLQWAFPVEKVVLLWVLATLPWAEATICTSTGCDEVRTLAWHGKCLYKLFLTKTATQPGFNYVFTTVSIHGSKTRSWQWPTCGFQIHGPQVPKAFQESAWVFQLGTSENSARNRTLPISAYSSHVWNGNPSSKYN